MKDSEACRHQLCSLQNFPDAALGIVPSRPPAGAVLFNGQAGSVASVDDTNHAFAREQLIDQESHGDEAVERAELDQPDLVILDAMLPKRSGFLVLEKLKGTNKKRGEKPFVIMITGNVGKRHQTWAESLGVDGYINKPFRMERLLETIEKIFAE